MENEREGGGALLVLAVRKEKIMAFSFLFFSFFIYISSTLFCFFLCLAETTHMYVRGGCHW